MTPRPAQISFRKDIHGLRGVSVLLVVFFHFGLIGFEGGYLGVDIFFVISGYLITSLLIREKQVTGKIRLGQFYLRRVKRIFPAAITVLAIFGLIAVLLLPSQADGFAQEMIGGVTALSNFFYAAQSNYFSLSSEEFLFLNYWSLAVEEQFYLIWPLLLGIGYSITRQKVWALRIALLCLIGISFYVWIQNESVGFYHLIGRWWELGLGAALALYERRSQSTPEILETKPRPPLSLMGVALIGIAMVLETVSAFSHPLIPIVLAAFGAVMLIADRRQTSLVMRGLSLKPIQFFGTISYSLYLVHWPLKTLTFLYLGEPLSGWMYVGLFLLSVIIAAALYYWIENPLRRGNWRSSRLVGGVGVAAISVVGLSACIMQGIIITKLSTTVIDLDYTKHRTPLQQSCLAGPKLYPGPQACRFGDMNKARVDFWLVGDSHAENWQPGLEALAVRHGLSGVIYAMSAKLPIFDIEQYKDDKPMAGSTLWRAKLLKQLQSAPPATVILSARWSLYYQTEDFVAKPKTSFYVTSSPDQPKDIETTRQTIEQELINTVQSLQAMGHEVVLLGQTPEFGINPLRCSIRAIEQGKDTRQCGPSSEEIMQYILPAVDMLKRVGVTTSAQTIFPHEDLCNESYCDLMIGETYLYRDDDHINPEGAKKLVDQLSVHFLESLTKH